MPGLAQGFRNRIYSVVTPTAVGRFLMVIFIFIMQYLFDMEFTCSCRPGVHPYTVLYIIFPPVIFAWLTNITEPIIKMRTFLRWYYEGCNVFCSCFCKGLLDYISLGVIWITAVLFDGDWYLCLWTNLNTDHTGIPCRNNLTNEEKLIKADYKTESLKISLIVIFTFVFIFSIGEWIHFCWVRRAKCCDNSFSEWCPRCATCCGTSFSERCPRCATCCDNFFSFFKACLCRAKCCYYSLSKWCIHVICCDCSLPEPKPRPYYRVVYEDLLEEQVRKQLNVKLLEMAKERAEAICRRSLNKIREDELNNRGGNNDDTWWDISAPDLCLTVLTQDDPQRASGGDPPQEASEVDPQRASGGDAPQGASEVDPLIDPEEKQGDAVKTTSLRVREVISQTN